MSPTTHVRVNGRWDLQLPWHRAVKYADPDQPWEKERLASMALNIDPTDHIFDIGTEEGDMSALFSSWVPDGGIVLVEPNPKVWPNIKLIWDANALKPMADWFVGFCSTEDTDYFMGTRDNWPRCAYGPVIADHGFRHLSEETDTTPQRRVDTLADGCPPSVITIDVEGAELQVLRGAEQTLREHHPRVWVSIHPEFMRHHFDQRPGQVLDFMESCGYRCVHLADDHESHWYMEPR